MLSPYAQDVQFDSEAAHQDDISAALHQLEAYIRRQRYRGYDPYDGLMSPLFRLPMLRSSKPVRLGFQQMLRRLPLNLRPLLGIRPGLNPVTLGLCLQASGYLQQLYPAQASEYRREAAWCLETLLRLQSRGYSGACWGYDFDWEARYHRQPAFTPTVVATGFVTNALFEYHQLTGDGDALAPCLSAVDFVRRDLQRTWRGRTFCFSYSPSDRQVVFNATMKGARLLAQAYSVTGDPALLDDARRTVEFVMAAQDERGAWAYAHGDSRRWIDNFHTAYLLDCLDAYIRLTSDATYQPQLQRGFDFYRHQFFTGDGAPKYYHNRRTPIDATAAAQSIITLCRFGEVAGATRVARWMITHMQDRRGYFWYRAYPWLTNRIPYMRWSNAWMYLALASLIYTRERHDLDRL